VPLKNLSPRDAKGQEEEVDPLYSQLITTQLKMHKSNLTRFSA